MRIDVKKLKVDELNKLKSLLQSLYDSAVYEKNDAMLQQKEANDYYFRRKPESAITGASRYIAPVVQEKVDDAHSLLTDVVDNFKDAFTVEGIHGGPQIDLNIESGILNEIERRLFNSDNDFTMNIMLKDALLAGTSAVRWFVKDRADSTVELFEDFTDLELLARKNNLLPTQELFVEEKRVIDTGDTLHSGRIITTIKSKEVSYEHIPFKRIYAVSDSSLNVKSIPYVMVKTYTTKQELVQQGYDPKEVAKVKYITDFEEAANDNSNNNGQLDYFDGHSYIDEGMNVVELREAYVRTSMFNKKSKGIGEPKLYKIVYSDNSIFEIVEDDCVNVAVFRPIPNISSFWGTSFAFKTVAQQDAETAMMRGYIDNIHNANHGRMTALQGQYNKRDLLDNRPRGIVEIEVQGAIQPFPYNPLPQGIDGLLGKIGLDADNATGLSAELMGRGEEAFNTGMTAAQVSINHSKGDLTIKKLANGIMVGIRDLAKGMYDEMYKMNPTQLPPISSLKFDVQTQAGRRSRSQELVSIGTALQQTGMMTPALKRMLGIEFMRNVGLARYIPLLKTPEQEQKEQQAKQQDPATQLQLQGVQAQIAKLQAEAQKLTQEAEVEAMVKAKELTLKQAQFEFDSEAKGIELKLADRKQTLDEFATGIETQIAMTTAANATTPAEVRSSLEAFNATETMANT